MDKIKKQREVKKSNEVEIETNFIFYKLFAIKKISTKKSGDKIKNKEKLKGWFEKLQGKVQESREKGGKEEEKKWSHKSN
jgi:hypothetical protein